MHGGYRSINGFASVKLAAKHLLSCSRPSKGERCSPQVPFSAAARARPGGAACPGEPPGEPLPAQAVLPVTGHLHTDPGVRRPGEGQPACCGDAASPLMPR